MELATQPFGALLRRFRMRAGDSQESLAENARLSVETISALERGARRNPYRDTVGLLATALRLTPAERSMLESAAGRSSTPAPVRATLRPVSTPSGNLPLQLTSFVGRDREVAKIATRVVDHRLVTLKGSGGVGKTRVALRVATHLADHMADGVWFVELAALRDPALLAGTIAAALRSSLPPDVDPLEALLALLARKRLLLILDNCEHLIAATGALVSALLQACPLLTVLATSRQTLRITGEVTVQIPSLAVPDETTAAALTPAAVAEFAAVTLFVDRARAADSGFTLTAENAPIVADICRRLDGLPLAIELAASRITILSPRKLRDRLNERLRILRLGGRDTLPRQQTLRALIDWSYDLLDERERQLFRRVGLFADSFTLEAAAAIAGDADGDELDTLDVLASLVDKSLVLAAVGADSTRFRLLESSRMYALETLVTHEERQPIEGAYIAFFSAALANATKVLETTGSDAPFAALTPDLENIRAALGYAVATHPAALGRLAVGAGRFFGRIGLAGEGIGWLEAALEVVDPADPRLQSRIWSAIAFLAGNVDPVGMRAFAAGERSVALARAAGDCELLAWALTRHALAAMDLSHRADAEAALAEAGELFGPQPEPYQRARLLSVRMYIAQCVGDRLAVSELGEELRILCIQTGNESGELTAMQNLAENFHAMGETERAIELVREASARVAAAGRDRETPGFLQVNLAAYLVAVDDLPAARVAGAQAIELLCVAGPGGWAVAAAIGHLALAHALSGDLERAARLLGFWDASLEELGTTLAFTERVTHDRLSALVADGFGPVEQRQALIAAGAALSPEHATAEALASTVP